MSNLINFNFGNTAIRTVTETSGEALFCAKDVCTILGYKNDSDAIAKHCKEKGVAKRDTPTKGGVQALAYINEPNLYRLIIKSRKPEAEKFEVWVMEEVLPSIRKTGTYTLTINAAQQCAIQEAVNAYVVKHQSSHQTVYRALKSKFKVAKYDQLPAVMFDECLNWLGGKAAAPQLEGIGQELKFAYWAMLAELDALSPQKGFYSEHCNQVDSAQLKDFTHLIPAMHTAITAFKRTITPVTPLPAEPSHREVSIEAWKVIDLNRDLHKVMQAVDGIAARVGGIGMLKSDLPDSWWIGKRLPA